MEKNKNFKGEFFINGIEEIDFSWLEGTPHHLGTHDIHFFISWLCFAFGEEF